MKNRNRFDRFDINRTDNFKHPLTVSYKVKQDSFEKRHQTKEECAMTERECFNANDVRHKIIDETDLNLNQYLQSVERDRKNKKTYERDNITENVDLTGSETSLKKNTLFTSIIDTLIEPFVFISKSISEKFNPRDITEASDDNLFTEETIITQPEKQRFTYKPDHIFITKQHNIPDIYPDDVNDDKALLYISLDENAIGINRTMVLLDKYENEIPKIYIAQKKAENSIFTGDNEYIHDDIIVAELPVKALDDKFREKLRKNNLANRGNCLQLEYEDFILFNEFIQNHPEIQKRMKFGDFKKFVRALDDETLADFDSKTIFMDYKVYNNIAAEKRNKLKTIEKGRVAKNYSVTVEDLNDEDISIDKNVLDNKYKKIEHGQYSGNSRFKGFRKYK
jgi:hypothetical protein